MATILRNQADYDEEQIASSYGLVNSFLWAIPVLGFIGTVIGLRAAIGALGITLRANGRLRRRGRVAALRSSGKI